MRRACLTLVGVMLAAVVAAAQERPVGVYIPDSTTAAEKLALAERMERLREWGRAVELYQEVLERHSDHVVPADAVHADEAVLFRGVGDLVLERLSAWPVEGLNVYRARYDAEASSRLEQSLRGDTGALREVFWKYFVTDAGAHAGARLVELHLLDGDFAGAVRVGRLLVERHPAPGAVRAEVLFRLALAQQFLGSPESAREALEQLKADHAEAVGTVRGREVVLVEALEEELEAVGPLVAHGGEDWPMYHGSADRSRVSRSEARAGWRLPPIGLSDRAAAGLREDQRVALEQHRGLDGGATLGIIPVADRGELFFQDNTRVYAVNLETAMPLSGWEGSAGGGQSGQSSFVPPGVQLTVTVTDDSVYAVLGQFDVAGTLRVPSQPSDARLVRLDRRTGRERWSVSPRQLPGEEPALQSLRFSAAPVVVEDRVYLVAQGSAGIGFEVAYMLCLSVDDGRLIWQSYLGSGHSFDPRMRRMMPQAQSDSSLHASYSAGLVYAATDLGVLAAVDAHSGAIAWLSLYPRQGTDFNRFRGGVVRPSFREQRPWRSNPAIVHQGRVFILPGDGTHVTIHDAYSGAVLKRISRRISSGLTPIEVEMLLAVRGDELILASDQQIVCWNWKEDRLEWHSAYLGRIQGRPFVTEQAIHVPTQKHLYRLRSDSAVEQLYPPRDSEGWSESEGPGNVLAVRDHLIVAGQRQVNIYTDLGIARRRLEGEVEQRPGDAQPLLRLSAVLFAAGEMELAVARLDQAIEALGGKLAMRSGRMRQEVFFTALRFAEQSKDSARVQALYDRAAWSAQSPSEQVRWRLSRARLAERRGGPEQIALELSLYHQVLSDPQLRQVELSDLTDGARTAGEVAEHAIRQRVNISGRGVYEPFERQARQAMELARQHNDPERMLEVARAFPNARVSETALLESAGAFESRGRHAEALEALRQSYRSDPNPQRQAQLLEGMARNYLAMGRYHAARGRLARGGQLPNRQMLSRPLRLPDGQVVQDVSLAEAHERVAAWMGTLEVDRPDFRLPVPVPRERTEPLREAEELAIGDVELLLSGSPGWRRHDRIVVWSSGAGLRVYPVGQTTPSVVLDLPRPQGLAWVDDGLLLWSDQSVWMVDGASGDVVWRREPGALEGGADLAVAPAPGPRGAGGGNEEVFVVIDGRLANVEQLRQVRVRAGRGEVAGEEMIVNVRGGVLVPRPGMVEGPARAIPAPPEPQQGPGRVHEVVAAGEMVLVSTTSGRLIAFGKRDGEPAWQSKLAEGRPIHRLLGNSDFVVAHVVDESTVQLVVLWTDTGQVRLRRVFNASPEAAPVNVALADEGMLIYTLLEKICGIDLHEPGEEPAFEEPQGGGGGIFAGAFWPQQLIIADDRVAAVSDLGQLVRVYDLRTGEPKNMPLATRSEDPQQINVSLRAVGRQLYVITPGGLMAYNLLDIDPERDYASFPSQPRPNFVDALIGREHLVLLDIPPDGQGASPVRLHSFARYAVSPDQPQESGRNDHVIELPAAARSIVGIEGGFGYLDDRGRVRVLLGTR